MFRGLKGHIVFLYVHSFLLSLFQYVIVFVNEVIVNQFIILLSMYRVMLNKNNLAVKKVRGQSEATMVISDQKL